MLYPPAAYVDSTGSQKGRGVFASRDFNVGEIVECCPVVIMEQPFAALPSELKTIVFNWGALAKTTASSAIALGFGSLYNHDNPANMRYAADAEAHVLIFSTVRPVLKGEELTVNYNAIGGGPTWDDDNWFTRNNIEPITGQTDAQLVVRIGRPNQAFDRSAQRCPVNSSVAFTTS